MVDVVEVSAIIAAAGVLVGVAYYILDMRNQTKLRQTDLIVRLYSFTGSKEFLEAWETLRDREIKSVDDYGKTYGSFTEINQVVGVFEELGILLKRRLIDLDLINDLMGDHVVIRTYEKLERFMKEIGEGKMTSSEYLYNEMKKREQRK